jgi:hypothetical protein
VWRRVLRASPSAALLILALVGSSPAAAGELRAGFGVAALPTPEGAPLSGYGGLRDRKAEGVLDAPEARALVLEQGDLRVGLVTLDLVIARPVLRDALVEEGRRIGVNSVVLVATHTHSGPGAYLQGWFAERATAGSFDPSAPERIVRGAARALARALGDLRAVRVGTGMARADLAENRRDPNGPRETALPVLRLQDPGGGVRRVLFSYGAHPTVLSPKSRLYSADYPGVARSWLGDQGWDAAFLPGPLGDQKPRSEKGPLWPDDLALQQEQVRGIGERLGDAVLSALAGIRLTADSRFAAVERWVELPPARARRGCMTWWLGPLIRGSLRRFMSPRVPIHAIQVGDAVIVALPAEPTSRVGERIRAQVLSGQVPFVISHANDWIGYVVAADRYREGGYEACLAFHGPDLADWLVTEATETLRRLSARVASSGKIR